MVIVQLHLALGARCDPFWVRADVHAHVLSFVQVDAKVRRLLRLASEQRTAHYVQKSADSDRVIPNELLQVRACGVERFDRVTVPGLRVVAMLCFCDTSVR